MKQESWFYKLLKRIGIIKTHEVSKKEMCESAKSVCNKNCENCAWQESEKPKYKATYKCLHCGVTKEFIVDEPEEAIAYFLQKGENIWEMYMLTSITLLGGAK